jgi:RND family efflux transporter MFP subunit
VLHMPLPHRLLPLGFTLTLLVVAGCSQGETAEDETGDQPVPTTAMPAPSSSTETTASPLHLPVMTGPDRDTAGARLVTILTARSQVLVRSRIPGPVTEVLAEEGRRVAAGTLLARLDDEPYRLRRDRAAAEAMHTRALHHRTQAAFQDDAPVRVVSEVDRDVATAEYLKAQADSAMAELELGHTRITSPIAGTVVDRRIQRGQWVAAQEGLYTIADLDVLWAVLVVPYERSQGMQVGQTLALTLDPGGQEQTIRGRLHLISPVMDATGGVKITIEVVQRGSDSLLPPELQGHLRSGMTVGFEDH